MANFAQNNRIKDNVFLVSIQPVENLPVRLRLEALANDVGINKKNHNVRVDSDFKGSR